MAVVVIKNSEYFISEFFLRYAVLLLQWVIFDYVQSLISFRLLSSHQIILSIRTISNLNQATNTFFQGKYTFKSRSIYYSLNLPPVNIIIMKVLGCLGAGSFGKVLKVEVDGHFYAVKKIGLEFDCEEDSWEMQSVKKQAQILAECLYHPNIVRYYSSYRRGDYFYIAMEYVHGHPLGSFDLPINSQAIIVSFIVQMLFALRYLKRCGIIHRDLKPSNILLSDKGLFKLVDFGISKQMDKSMKAASCLGTPYYTAPEIMAEEKYDFKVDIWSFGVILYEICHGTLPFLGNSMDELKKNIRHHHPLLKSDLHDDIKLIIRGCLTKNPSKRFTIEQMLKLPLISQQIMQEIKSKEKEIIGFK